DFALVSGRLVEEKGFDTAILAARTAEVPLVVAGAGPDESRLRRLANGAAVRFMGRLDEPRVADVRARACVVLAPSRWEEPCPYSVLDALAAGVAVVASDRGGLPELVGPDNVVPADDRDGWAAAVARYWSDRELRLSEGEKALRRAKERFGEDAYYEKLIEVYGG